MELILNLTKGLLFRTLTDDELGMIHKIGTLTTTLRKVGKSQSQKHKYKGTHFANFISLA